MLGQKSASVVLLGIYCQLLSNRAVPVCIFTSNVLSYFLIFTNMIGEKLVILEVLVMQVKKEVEVKAQMERKELYKELR